MYACNHRPDFRPHLLGAPPAEPVLVPVVDQVDFLIGHRQGATRQLGRQQRVARHGARHRFTLDESLADDDVKRAPSRVVELLEHPDTGRGVVAMPGIFELGRRDRLATDARDHTAAALRREWHGGKQQRERRHNQPCRTRCHARVLSDSGAVPMGWLHST